MKSGTSLRLDAGAPLFPVSNSDRALLLSASKLSRSSSAMSTKSPFKIRFTSCAGTTGSTEFSTNGALSVSGPFSSAPINGEQRRLCPSYQGGHHHQRMGGQALATSLSRTLPGWDLQWCEYSIIHPLMRGPTSPASTHTHRAIAGATCHQAPLITTHSTTVLPGLWAHRGPTRALSHTHGSVYLWSLPPLCPTRATTLVKAGGLSARALRPVCHHS